MKPMVETAFPKLVGNVRDKGTTIILLDDFLLNLHCNGFLHLRRHVDITNSSLEITRVHVFTKCKANGYA